MKETLHWDWLLVYPKLLWLMRQTTSCHPSKWCAALCLHLWGEGLKFIHTTINSKLNGILEGAEVFFSSQGKKPRWNLGAGHAQGAVAVGGLSTKESNGWMWICDLSTQQYSLACLNSWWRCGLSFPSRSLKDNLQIWLLGSVLGE